MEDKDVAYMRLAIEEAKKSLKLGGAPIGAVIVKEGEVISTGQSLVWPHKDPSAHAETECIRNATKKLNTLDLQGCTLYSTLESCSMCLSCGAWSGLTRFVFGAYKEDIPTNPYEIKNYHAEEHAKNLVVPVSNKPIEVKGGILRNECAELMQSFKNWSPI